MENPDVQQAPLTEELLSLDEAIRFLDTSKSTLYRLLNQEDIKGVKVGKQWRFRKADLETYLERGAATSTISERARVDLEAELQFFLNELKQAASSSALQS